MNITKKRIYSFSILFVLLAFASGCKVADVTRDKFSQKVPSAFPSVGDSATIAKISWKDFFADPMLVSLIDSALQNNQDMKIALERIKVADAAYFQSRGSLLPSLSLLGRAGVERFGEYTMNGVGNFDSNLSDNVRADQRIPNPTPDYFTGLGTSWEIDLWGRLRHQKRADYLRFLSSWQGRHAVQTRIVYEVAFHYYELLALDQEMKIIKDNIDLQAKALELMEIQKSAGRVTQVAVEQTRAQLLNTKALEFNIAQAIIEQENLLNRLLGDFGKPVRRSSALADQNVPNTSQPGLPFIMLTRRPDVVEARLNWFSSSADVAAAKAAFYPTLTLSAFTGFNAFRSDVLFDAPASLVYGLTSGITAPLFQRNQIRGNYRIATARERQAYYEYEKSVIGAYQEVVQYVSQVENLRRSRELKQQEAEGLRRAVADANELFAAGYASYLEVITAQKTLLQAELDLAILKKSELQAFTGMYRSVGGGWD